jgi:hypothetical protein
VWPGKKEGDAGERAKCSSSRKADHIYGSRSSLLEVCTTKGCQALSDKIGARYGDDADGVFFHGYYIGALRYNHQKIVHKLPDNETEE